MPRLACFSPKFPLGLLWLVALSALSFTPKCLPAQQGPFETTSLLGAKLYALPDDGSIAAAQKALAANPASPDLAIKLSLAQAGRRQYNEAVATDTAALAANPKYPLLYLERGHRELGLREFLAAQHDLEFAAQLFAELHHPNLDVYYHLGLAYYFQGKYGQAAAALTRARDLAPLSVQPEDSLIDCTAWLSNAARRAGNDAANTEALSRITPAVKNTEPHLFFYLQLLHFYQGKATAAEILPRKPAPGDTEAALSFNTISYGIANWDLAHEQADTAQALFHDVVKGEAWNSWGFVGSEVELARLAHPTSEKPADLTKPASKTAALVR